MKYIPSKDIKVNGTSTSMFRIVYKTIPAEEIILETNSYNEDRLNFWTAGKSL